MDAVTIRPAGPRDFRQAAGLLADSGLPLLTETAARFFPRFGFAVEDRSSAPPAVRESVEFRAACPASAVMMHARVDTP